jgi:OPA family glycerol-3-phosphate transporter-like MFS transporter
MGLAALVTLLIPSAAAQITALVVLLFLAGFLVYGPQASYWALCPDLLGVRLAGTGVGIMDACAYLFAGLGNPLIGWTIDLAGTTDVAFYVVGCSAVASALCVSLVRR